MARLKAARAEDLGIHAATYRYSEVVSLQELLEPLAGVSKPLIG